MYKSLVVALIFLFSAHSNANEKKLENEGTVFNETFSWQAQIGMSVYYADITLQDVEQNDLANFLRISLLVDFYYKGFFIQSNHRRHDTHTLGGEVGYQLRVEDDWELDIISRTYFSGFNPEYIQDEASKNIEIINGLDNRAHGNGLGIRYSRYFENSQLSIDVSNLAITSNAKGWVFEAFYSHLVPYRNWDIYLNSSFSYYSQDVMDYYVGVKAHEVSEIRPQYEADHDIKLQLEAFFQHPISESWTFNGGLSYSRYLGNITDSPIIDQADSTHVMMGVLYVF